MLGWMVSFAASLLRALRGRGRFRKEIPHFWYDPQGRLAAGDTLDIHVAIMETLAEAVHRGSGTMRCQRDIWQPQQGIVWIGRLLGLRIETGRKYPLVL